MAIAKKGRKGSTRTGEWIMAVLAGENLYHGKLCKKHPEIEGLRYAPSACCVFCAQERSLRVSKEKAAARQERTE